MPGRLLTLQVAHVGHDGGLVDQIEVDGGHSGGASYPGPLAPEEETAVAGTMNRAIRLVNTV